MEENYKAEDTPLTRLVGRYVNNLIDYNVFEKAVKELYSNKEGIEPTLKEFDIEAAKACKPVCTRDGRKARIICFDRVTNSTNEYTGHLIVLVTNPNGDEQSFYYTEKGNLAGEDEYDNHKWDLMMPLEKKEGWAKIRKDINLYDTKEEADRKMIGNDEYVTVKVFWEE